MVRLEDFLVKLGGQPVFPRLSLTVVLGERIGLAGASGCGKTTVLQAVAGLLNEGASITGSISTSGTVGYVPQESLASLSPYRTLLDQVEDLGGNARGILTRLGIGDERLLRSYPHQVSGGQRQRFLIAQALIGEPALLVCDEPVANLDSATARDTLVVLNEYLERTGAALLIASHREEVFSALGCRVHRMTPQHLPQALAASTPVPAHAVAVMRDVSKTHFRRDWLLRQHRSAQALKDVSLTIHAGETVALVGPSGAGKSTLVRCLSGREEVDRGVVHVPGVQLVPQDASESLNPRLTVAEAMREAHPSAKIDLPESWASRKMRTLSTGQRARVAVARSLAALDAGLLILDESLSGLDGATAGEMLGAIRKAQAERGLACLLIAHDESLVSGFANRVVRMEKGRIVA